MEMLDKEVIKKMLVGMPRKEAGVAERAVLKIRRVSNASADEAGRPNNIFLSREVCEGSVSLCHPMTIFLLLEGCALLIVSIYNFSL